MAFQRFTPHRYLGSGTTRRLQDFTPVIPSFLRKEQGDAILGLDDVLLTYPVTLGPFTFFRVVLDISVLTGPRLADTDLSDKFEQDGWIVLRELGTTNKFQVAVSSSSALGRQTEEPYEYNFADFRGSTISAEFRAFTTALQGNNFVLELWDEEPSDDPDPEPTPDPGPGPSPGGEEPWESRLIGVIESTPQVGGMPDIREKVFPDIFIKPKSDKTYFPHVVYSETSAETIGGFEGSFEIGVRVDIDFRSEERATSALMARRCIPRLRDDGIVTSISSKVTFYDFETKLFRYIVSVVVNPRANRRQAAVLTGARPWSAQWSAEFG